MVLRYARAPALALAAVMATSCQTEMPGPVGTSTTTPDAGGAPVATAGPVAVSSRNVAPITTPIVMRVRPFDCQRVEVNAVFRLDANGQSSYSQYAYTADFFGVGVGENVATTIQNAWVQGRQEGRPVCSELPMTRMLLDNRGNTLDATVDTADTRVTIDDIEDQILRLVRETNVNFATFPEQGVRSGDVLFDGETGPDDFTARLRTVALGMTQYQGRDVLVSQTTGRVDGPFLRNGGIERVDYHDLDSGMRVAASSTLDMRLAVLGQNARMLVLETVDVVGACRQEEVARHCIDPQQPIPLLAALNSCQFAFDGDCDEPGRGTGLCTAGTDTADCSLPQGANSCQFAFDGECDHPGVGTGACPPRTDVADCSSPALQTAGVNNSCQWAFDGECDDSRYEGAITGACRRGTDASDCRGLRLRSPQELAGNECQWAFSGTCDDTGFFGSEGGCARGTDTADCRSSRPRPAQSLIGNECPWAFDGECDDARFAGAVTDVCASGTDTADCQGLRLRSSASDRANSCQWAYDGECDERGIGTGLCQPGTDSADCRPSSRAGS